MVTTLLCWPKFLWCVIILTNGAREKHFRAPARRPRPISPILPTKESTNEPNRDRILRRLKLRSSRCQSGGGHQGAVRSGRFPGEGSRRRLRGCSRRRSRFLETEARPIPGARRSRGLASQDPRRLSSPSGSPRTRRRGPVQPSLLTAATKRRPVEDGLIARPTPAPEAEQRSRCVQSEETGRRTPASRSRRSCTDASGLWPARRDGTKHR